MAGLLILHGGVLPASASDTWSGFFLWMEGAFASRPGRDRHPRGLDVEAAEAVLRAEPAAHSLVSRTRRARVDLTLPAMRGRPLPSQAALRDPDDYVTDPPVLRAFEVDVLMLPPAEVLDALLLLPESLKRKGSALLPGDDLEYWSEIARWAFDLLRRRRIAPSFDRPAPRWRPVLTDPHERDRFQRFAAAMPPVARTPQAADVAERTMAFPAATDLLTAFLDGTIDAAARAYLVATLPAERRHPSGSDERRLVASLAQVDAAVPHVGADEAGTAEELRAGLAGWTQPVFETLPEGALRLGIRLSPPAPAADPPEWHLAYHLEPADDPSHQLPADEIWSAAEPASRSFGRPFSNPEETLLARLGAAAAISPSVTRSLAESHPVGAELSLEEAHRFLTEEAPLLSESGVAVYLPAGGTLTRVGVRLEARAAAPAGLAVTRFGLATLVEFDWKVSLGDAVLSPAEFEELAAKKIPLVSVRGEWVLLDRGSVERTLQLFDRRPGGRTTLGDFLRLAGGLDAGTTGYPIESIEADGWLGGLLSPEAVREEILAVETPSGLVGTLRPYQIRGVGWLRFLTSRGLGACLADDMGLGKTVQFLATLLHAREVGESLRPSLLVCPTSVAESWRKEAARFAPSLVVAVHHGPDRASGESLHELLTEVDLLVTTYALAHRDRALLGSVEWEYVALDEAQNVKNPAAAQSRAVRSFKARRRAALTGTPVENRLSELKAIFDFLHPGLLGTDEAFRSEFSVPIERHRDKLAAERLRRITAPFLLRRSKSDPTIAPDLPEKIETKEWVGLTREQATLYRATTKALLSGIGRASGRSRRAKVLLLLLRLKQICNHPAHFLGDGSRLDGRSGKLMRLLEMLEETLAEKNPALIFTQFAEMGHHLVSSMKERFGTEVLFLHGGVPRKARDEMVRRFQEDEDAPPFFVLSLRAGGSGLNLTRASHIFHFDRWWNPAVEDQATDRAHRLGQQRHVQVHKFVCRGTLEERIDEMIEEKKSLARTIVGAGEEWIANLTDDELAHLVALSRDAVEGEGR